MIVNLVEYGYLGRQGDLKKKKNVKQESQSQSQKRFRVRTWAAS